MIVHKTHGIRWICCLNVVQPLRGSHTEAARAPITVESLRDDCTEMARFLYNLRAASVRIFLISHREFVQNAHDGRLYIHVHKPYPVATYNARNSVQKIVSSIKLSHGAYSG